MIFVIQILLLATVFIKIVICFEVNLSTQESLETIHHFNEVVIMKLPNVDPLEFDLVELSYPGKMISANVNISKGSITGLGNYRLFEMQFSKTEPAVTFHILFPFIKLYAEYYEFDGRVLYVVPMKGQGVAHFDIHNLQLKGTLYIKKAAHSPAVMIDRFEDAVLNIERIVWLDGEVSHVKMLPLRRMNYQNNANMCIASTGKYGKPTIINEFEQSRTEFDHNIDNIISAIVEDLFAGYINSFNKYILTTYSDTIIKYVNDIIT